MPVARIISSSVEDALKFADYLRPLFDTVEIAQPGRASKTAVDLEVNLELCTPEQAWQQIAQAGECDDAEVFVAPGTLFAEPGQPQEAADAENDAQSMDHVQPDLEDANRDLDAIVTQASAAAASTAGSNGSGALTPDYAAAAPQQGLGWLGRLRESLRQRLAVRALLREIHEMEEQRRAEEHQRQRQMALQFERERRDKEMQQFASAPVVEQPVAEVRELEQMQELPESVFAMDEEQAFRRQAEQEMLRRQAEEEEAISRGIFVEQILQRRAREQGAATDHTAEREAEPLEAQVEEAFAEPELAELQSASENAFAEPEPAELQSASENAFEEPEPAELQPLAEEALAEPEALVTVRSFSRGSGGRLRPAMAMAGATSVLLTAVLFGYANRRPASPLPVSALQRSTLVQQKVPFGSAVVSSPAPALENGLIPEAEAPTTPLETASAAASPSEIHNEERDDFRRIRVGKHEVDYVSDDVTVRHFIYKRRGSVVAHPAAAVHMTTNSNGVKQISDLQ